MARPFQGLQRCAGSFVSLPAGESGSGRPLCFASWQGQAIAFKARLALNRFLSR